MLSFKTDREKAEWAQLQDKNPALHAFGETLATFVSLELMKDVLVTSVFRTQAEQDALYAGVDPAHKITDSPHMHWSAFDIRSIMYNEEEIKRILAFANTFRYTQGLPVAIYHVIAGNRYHCHFQYKGHF